MSQYILAEDLLPGDCVFIGSTYHAVRSAQVDDDGYVTLFLNGSDRPLKVLKGTKFDPYFDQEEDDSYDE